MRIIFVFKSSITDPRTPYFNLSRTKDNDTLLKPFPRTHLISWLCRHVGVCIFECRASHSRLSDVPFRVVRLQFHDLLFLCASNDVSKWVIWDAEPEGKCVKTNWCRFLSVIVSYTCHVTVFIELQIPYNDVALFSCVAWTQFQFQTSPTLYNPSSKVWQHPLHLMMWNSLCSPNCLSVKETRKVCSCILLAFLSSLTT